MDLLGHSAGGAVATLYAARYADRIGRLVLVTPNWRATGLEFTEEEWLASIRRRAGEPWFAESYAVLQRLPDGVSGPAERRAVARLFFGRWNAAAVEYSSAARWIRRRRGASWRSTRRCSRTAGS